METNEQLSGLNLEQNSIGPNGGSGLALALQRNRKSGIQTLHLGGNKIPSSVLRNVEDSLRLLAQRRSQERAQKEEAFEAAGGIAGMFSKGGKQYNGLDL